MLSKRQFFLIAALFFVIVIGGVAFILDGLHRQAFEGEARNRAEMVTGFGKACRTYAKETLRPAVQQHTDEMIVEAMSSTFVARGIFDSFDAKMAEYQYEQPTLNPLNLDSRADDYEKEIIAQFNENPELDELTGYRSRDGEGLGVTFVLECPSQQQAAANVTLPLTPSSDDTTFGSSLEGNLEPDSQS